MRRLSRLAPIHCLALLVVMSLLELMAPAALAAQGYGRAPRTEAPSGGPLAAAEGVAFDQVLGAQVPLDAVVTTSEGRRTRLGELLAPGRPTLLVPVYYDCPMLCPMVLNGVATTLRAMTFTAGEEYELVVLSFDPRETPEQAAKAKRGFSHRLGTTPEKAAGAHFLVADEAESERIFAAVGFAADYLPERNEFAHAAGVVALTPEGRVARYFYGVEYPPRDLRLGLVEAAGGSIGTPVDQVLLYCLHYDPATGRYSAVVLNILRLAGLATLAVIGLYFLVTWRRGRRRSRAAHDAHATHATP